MIVIAKAMNALASLVAATLDEGTVERDREVPSKPPEPPAGGFSYRVGISGGTFRRAEASESTVKRAYLVDAKIVIVVRTETPDTVADAAYSILGRIDDAIYRDVKLGTGPESGVLQATVEAGVLTPFDDDGSSPGGELEVDVPILCRNVYRSLSAVA